ncbi:MAG: hypothetical protein R3C44_24470 [Chloroflexota bacterium]
MRRQSTALLTELHIDHDDVFRHTEAVAYFDNSILKEWTPLVHIT